MWASFTRLQNAMYPRGAECGEQGSKGPEGTRERVQILQPRSGHVSSSEASRGLSLSLGVERCRGEQGVFVACERGAFRRLVFCHPRLCLSLCVCAVVQAGAPRRSASRAAAPRDLLERIAERISTTCGVSHHESVFSR